MNIVYIYADSGPAYGRNSSNWRCFVPAAALVRAGHQATCVSTDDFCNAKADAQCEAADVIVVERIVFGEALRQMQRWKERGKAIVVDFDDAYDFMPRSCLAFPFWEHGTMPAQNGQPVRLDIHPLEQFKLALSVAHLCTAPSRLLVEDWTDYGDVRYLPNYIDLQRYANTKREPHDGIWLGWGGSLSHLQSWMDSGILPALKYVCKVRPQVKLFICGSDRSVVEMLPIPLHQLMVQEWVGYDDWPQTLAQFDIGLAPLAGEYDRRRSWIKVLEYMLMGIPWIASDYPSYQDFVGHGHLVKNTATLWEGALLQVIDNLERIALAWKSNAIAVAAAAMIDENMDKIIELYEEAVRKAQIPALALTDKPRVSVVIPCYNLARYLPEAVRSVVIQTYTDNEIVIVDDGSPDDTPKVAEQLIANHPQRCIRYLRQENRGLSAARNAGIQAASGEYILPLDADDVLKPSALESLVAILDAEPEIGVAYPDYETFGLGQSQVVCMPEENYQNPSRISNGMPYCALYRRSVWEAVGGYNENMRGSEDWDFWLGCLEHDIQVRHVPFFLFLYRIRRGSMTSVNAGRDAEFRNQMRANHPELFELAGSETP